jgi:glutathione S-transferase
MKLYGTTTSPFVRRVRVVAAECGAPVELVNTATDVGMAQLRELSPIRKVPIAVIEGRTLFDSRVIIDWLTTTRGYGGLAPAHDRWREANLVNAIDSALDATISLFYLRRDGIAIDGTAFAERQLERVGAIFGWLSGELVDGARGFGDGLGLAEVSLIAALDWMEFRATYPVERAPALLAVRAAWAERVSLAATRPHT